MSNSSRVEIPTFLRGVPFKLTGREVQILAALAENPAGIFPYEVAGLIYGAYTIKNVNSFKVHVSNINRKCDRHRIARLVLKGSMNNPYRLNSTLPRPKVQVDPLEAARAAVASKKAREEQAS